MHHRTKPGPSHLVELEVVESRLRRRFFFVLENDSLNHLRNFVNFWTFCGRFGYVSAKRKPFSERTWKKGHPEFPAAPLLALLVAEQLE